MVQRYRVKVNRAGIFFTGVTIFLGVSAVNTSNNLLYLVVSFLLSFMLLSGMLSLYNLKGLSLYHFGGGTGLKGFLSHPEKGGGGLYNLKVSKKGLL